MAPLVRPASIIRKRDEAMRAVCHNCAYLSLFYDGERFFKRIFPVFARLIALRENESSKAREFAFYRTNEDHLADILLAVKREVNAVHDKDEPAAFLGEWRRWRMRAFPCSKTAMKAKPQNVVRVPRKVGESANACIKA